MSSLIERLRARLVPVPKPGTEPRFVRYGDTMRGLICFFPKIGDDAGECQLGGNLAAGASGFMVQPHVWATEPLCEESALAIEELKSVLREIGERVEAWEKLHGISPAIPIALCDRAIAALKL